MNPPTSSSEYLLLSRGKWNPDASPEKIQEAIDTFYAWIDRHIAEGRMKPGQRLAAAGATVSKARIVTDGPYGETKEVIGGYWFIIASSLDEAARLAAENPCLQLGLFFEIRPIESIAASADRTTCETPTR